MSVIEPPGKVCIMIKEGGWVATNTGWRNISRLGIQDYFHLEVMKGAKVENDNFELI